MDGWSSNEMSSIRCEAVSERLDAVPGRAIVATAILPTFEFQGEHDHSSRRDESFWGMIGCASECSWKGVQEARVRWFRSKRWRASSIISQRNVVNAERCSLLTSARVTRFVIRSTPIVNNL